MSEKWFIIVNPNAGKKKGKQDWPGITRLLAEAGIEYLSFFTEHRGHAIELTKKYIRTGFRKFIVVGGDGTLNEVVNGIFSQNHMEPSGIILGMIPVGTGNDWCRMFHIPHDYEAAIRVIKENKQFVQDTGIMEYVDHEGNKAKRYFVNIAGMGFDAMVAEKTNKDKDLGKGNPLSYYINIFTSLFSFKITKTKIVTDNHEFKAEVFSMTAAIGQYNGGGMKQAPNSIPDDGLLDLTIIRKIGKFKVIRNVINLLDGSFVKLPEVSEFRTSVILIESTPDLYAETDGESMGKSPFRFSVLPRSLHIVVGEAYH
jgi:YegS/Rv2252/BmrU family lipid kinase